MKPFRYTIASLSVAIAVVSLDIAWLKYLLTTHRSALGFFAEGADCGIFLMANVLPFGLYQMLSRRDEQRRFWVGFEVGGLAAALAFACGTWLAPDAMWRVAQVTLDPAWNLLFGWVPNGTIEGLVCMMIFLTAGFGVPQLLVALICGILAGRISRQRNAAAADLRPDGKAPTGLAPGDQAACERSVIPSRCIIGAV